MALYTIPINDFRDLWRQFHTSDSDGNTWLYRGHNDASWKLVPTLFRLDKPRDYSWLTFQDYMLSRFKKQSIPYLNKVPSNEIEWLAIGQHHGLPTSLLDWTENPLIALFFALNDLDSKTDAALWTCAFPQTQEKIETINSISQPIVYYPHHTTPRISAQRGCFTVHEIPQNGSDFIPLEESEFVASTEMYKNVIPSDKREPFKWTLDRMGVDQFTAFPDLDGLAKKLKWDAYKLQYMQNELLPILRKKR